LNEVHGTVQIQETNNKHPTDFCVFEDVIEKVLSESIIFNCFRHLFVPIFAQISQQFENTANVLQMTLIVLEFYQLKSLSFVIVIKSAEEWEIRILETD